MSEEKRIYVVVAETVQPQLVYDGEGFARIAEFSKDVDQVPGRLAAQVGHVVSKLRLARAQRYLKAHTDRGEANTLKNFIESDFEPFTTIVLAARDSLELLHIQYLLTKIGIRHEVFNDTNSHVYGTLDEVMTAIAIGPVEASDLKGITDYLPLYNPKLKPSNH